MGLNLSRTRRWALLAVVSSALFLIAIDNSILYTALPTLTKELHASSSQGLWIINAYPVTVSGLLLGAGVLGDRVGHVRLVQVGLVIFGLASVVGAFAPTAEVLIAARALLAVGAAAMMPATLALIRLGFDDLRERSIAIAVWSAVAVIGTALGPIAGGLLLLRFWWGSVFLVNVPIVLLALIGLALIAPKNDPNPTKHWDALSSFLAMVGLISLVLAIKEFAHAGPSIIVMGIALAVAAVSLTWFALRQRGDDPTLDFKLFTNPAFSSGVIAAAITLFVISGIEFATTQRFQLVADFTPMAAGILVTALGVGTIPTSLLAGAYGHRFGLRIVVTGGLATTVVGSLLAIFSFDTSLPLLVIGFVISGLGLGAVITCASSAIVGNAPKHRAGMASAVEEVSYEFGGLLAVALLGTLLSAVYVATLPSGFPAQAAGSLVEALSYASANASIIETARSAFDNGYRIVLLVITAVAALGTGISWWLLKGHGPGTEAAPHGH